MTKRSFNAFSDQTNNDFQDDEVDMGAADFTQLYQSCAFVLKEKWDPIMLDLISRSHDFKESVKPQLTSFDENGYIEVRYAFAKSAPPGLGRYVGQTPCAQFAKGIVRRLCMHKFYHDIDQVNSSPTIIMQLCDKYNIPCPRLSEYVMSRAHVFDELYRDYGIVQADAKRLFTSLTYGMSAKLAPNIPKVHQFAAEMKEIRTKLLATNMGCQIKNAYANHAQNDLQFIECLVNLCEANKVQCSVLKDYLNNRTQLLASTEQRDRVPVATLQQYIVMVGCGRQIPNYPAGLAAIICELKDVRTSLNQDRGYANLCRQYFPSDLTLFSQMIFDEERRISQVIVNYFINKRFVIGCWIHDGIMIERRSDTCDMDIMLRECEDLIKIETGYMINLKEKSMEPSEDDIRKLKNSLRVLENETHAAREVMLQKPDQVVLTKMGIVVFQPELGTFSTDEKNNIKRALPILLTTMEARLKGKYHRTHFLQTVVARQNMYQMLLSNLSLKAFWLEESIAQTKYKICFTNGYLDFKAGVFVPGTFQHLKFTRGIDRPLGPRNNELVQQVLDEVFSRAYTSTKVRDYMLKALAKAVCGDLMKQGYFIVGPSNSGKGVLTLLLLHALPSLVLTTNPSCFCKETSNDPAKDYSWLCNVYDCRVLITNEFNLRGANAQTVKINANIWKSVVSGGTDEIECRLLHQNLVKVIPQFTPFIFVNDMPQFDHSSDTGVQSRTVVTYMDRRAVTGEPSGPLEFKADDTLKERVILPTYGDACVWLLFDYYQLYLQEGLVPPPEIQQATSERVPTDGFWETILQAFEIPINFYTNHLEAVHNGFFVPTAKVYEHLKREGNPSSSIAVVKLLEQKGIKKFKSSTQLQCFANLRARVL